MIKLFSKNAQLWNRPRRCGRCELTEDQRQRQEGMGGQRARME